MMPCIVLKIKEETVCVQHRDNAIAHHGLFEPGMPISDSTILTSKT